MWTSPWLAWGFVFLILGGVVWLVSVSDSAPAVSFDRLGEKAFLLGLKRLQMTPYIEVDSPAWFKWLSRPTVRRFTLYGSDELEYALCTFYKQGRGKNAHWFATRQGFTKDEQIEIGAYQKMTLATLKKAADVLVKYDNRRKPA
jgi:hypothetical protein